MEGKQMQIQSFFLTTLLSPILPQRVSILNSFVLESEFFHRYFAVWGMWVVHFVSIHASFLSLPGVVFDYWLSLNSLLSAITSSKSLIFSVMISVLLLWAIFSIWSYRPQVWIFATTHSFLQLIYCVVYLENCVFDPWRLLSAVVKSP